MSIKKHPQTIQIFLPDGDPTGIRIAEITTSIIRAIEVPSSMLDDFLKMEEANQVALYYLIGSDNSHQTVYIGQTSDLATRLKSHNKEKDFWNKAIIFVSITNNITNTHALYLEYLSIQKANEVNRYNLKNGNSGSKPHTPKPLQAECDFFFDIIENSNRNIRFYYVKTIKRE